MLGPISRMLAVNAVTGLLYVFLIFPHLPQVSYHFRQIFEVIPLEAFWVFYAWSHYSTGTNFSFRSRYPRSAHGCGDVAGGIATTLCAC